MTNQDMSKQELRQWCIKATIELVNKDEGSEQIIDLAAAIEDYILNGKQPAKED